MNYIVADPTGNITVLILSPYTDTNRNDMIRTAFDLVPACEQAGFVCSIGKGHTALEMMGYEFCANASLSAAAWQALQDGIRPGESAVITLDSSGTDTPLAVRITRLDDNLPHFTCSITLPLPAKDKFKGYPVIHMDGISHMIIPSSDFTDDEAMNVIRTYADALDVPALGMILYDEIPDHTDTDHKSCVKIRPLVYVRESNTLVWEHGCGSGSTAIGYYRYLSKQIKNTDVHQPGGVMHISIENGNPVLTGDVIIYISRVRL